MEIYVFAFIPVGRKIGEHSGIPSKCQIKGLRFVMVLYLMVFGLHHYTTRRDFGYMVAYNNDSNAHFPFACEMKIDLSGYVKVEHITSGHQSDNNILHWIPEARLTPSTNATNPQFAVRSRLSIPNAIKQSREIM
jgi:hypothetical protein